MPKFAPQATAGGAVLQSGIPFGAPRGTEAGGLLVRGVVIATYVYDDPNHPFANRQPAAMYCDVLVYTQLTGGRTYVVRGALVAQEFSSIQAGIIHKPRAATQTISGQPLDPSKPIDPCQLDGDHVLVGFIDDRRTQPVVLRAIPPPNQDIGHEDDVIGHRARLILTDGDPLFVKSHGSYAGFTDDGSFVCDVSQANAGAVDSSGKEVPSAGGGSITHRAKLSAGSTIELVDPASDEAVVKCSLSNSGLSLTFGSLPGALSINGAAGPLLTIPSPGSVQLGSGGAYLVSPVALQAYLTGLLIPWLATHTHPGPNLKPPEAIPPPAPPSPLSLSNLAVTVPGL